MKVILRKDVPKLGSIGDVKQVANGYGRNFLLPCKLAELATPGRIKFWKDCEARVKKQREQGLASAQDMASKLSQMTLSFSRSVGENGRLFGSVGKSDIIKSLKASSLEVHKDFIQLDSAIKAVGDYEVEIALKPGVSAKIKVSVSARSK